MLDIMKKLRKFWEFGAGRTAAAALAAHSVSISIGICQGYSAILIPQLTASPDFHITQDQGSWLASLGAVTNPVGSIASGVLAEWCGRRLAIQLSTVPFLVGWLCIAFGTDLWWLYAGRLVTGIAAGMSSACYTYVSEVSPAEHRGLLQALGPVCASLGIFLAYVLGWLLDWLYVARVALVFCVLTVAAARCFPESPAHLLKRGRTADSLAAYAWFRRSDALAREEVDAYLREHGSDAKDPDSPESGSGGGGGGGGGARLSDYASAACVKPLLLLVTLFLLQELSGIYSILYYTVSFFEETGVEVDDYLCSVLVGGVRLVMAVAAAFLIARFGRRTLCVASAVGMSLSMLALAAYFACVEGETTRPPVPTLPLYLVALNVLCSMAGMLPVPWVLVGELFPLRVRSVMAGVVICVAQCFIFVCVKIYPDLVRALRFSGTLFTFLAASVAAALFCWLCLPETKGRSLLEIERYFRGEKKQRRADGVEDGVEDQTGVVEVMGGDRTNNNNNVVLACDKAGVDNAAFEAGPQDVVDASGRDAVLLAIKDVDR